jgi:endonuclease IV
VNATIKSIVARQRNLGVELNGSAAPNCGKHPTIQTSTVNIVVVLFMLISVRIQSFLK